MINCYKMYIYATDTSSLDSYAQRKCELYSSS